MQEKSTTVAAYAAGASLAAVALFYVFGPNYTIDGEEIGAGNRKKSIVGLTNPANDCFINSVLQALAGLGDLRLYLIRELHRRELDGPEIYNSLPGEDEQVREKRPNRVRELQQGTITRALKEMLDRLNERPIYKKTISARGFIQALEFAYRTRISRNQQDAQEFLQIVAERLSDEYHAGVKARQRAQRALEDQVQSEEASTEIEVRVDDGTEKGLPAIIDTKLKEIDNEYGFPFEGKMESQIECQHCRYKYKPNQTSFVNLTLQVPQKSSTTLNACFDGLLKTEYIDDFRCDKCRLQHAVEFKARELAKARSPEDRQALETEIENIQHALTTDPESALDGVTLPPSDLAPKRKIARHMRITVFPKIIAIHLSRSIFDRSSSTKNAAKVSFPERLPLGGILNQNWFKLLAIVCHKGSHNSGHYESFRRNHLYPPFSTPSVFSSYAQSRATSENPSRVPSPRLSARSNIDTDLPALNISTPPSTSSPSTSSLSPSPSEPSRSPSSTDLPRTSTSSQSQSQSHSHSQLHTPPPRPSTSSRISFQSTRSNSKSTTSNQTHNLSPTSAPRGSSLETARLSTTVSRTSGAAATDSETSGGGGSVASRLRMKKRKVVDRWWRISDEKIKECKTGDVLGMQKEVYLLFYELERGGGTV